MAERVKCVCVCGKRNKKEAEVMATAEYALGSSSCLLHLSVCGLFVTSAALSLLLGLFGATPRNVRT